jgi:hypothetical protein
MFNVNPHPLHMSIIRKTKSLFPPPVSLHAYIIFSGSEISEEHKLLEQRVVV